MPVYQTEQVLDAFRQLVGRAPTVVVRAPGRINIIGEHTDYNDGFVLPGAVDKAITFAAASREDRELHLHALDIDRQAVLDLDRLTPTEELWINYLAGIAQQFQLRGHETSGLDVVFGGNLPVGSGMSSSAALECGMAGVWNELTGAGLSGPELALLAQASSHQFVGIPCGIMDQFASLMGREDRAILLDCRSLHYELIPVSLAGYDWLLVNSKITHELGTSEYPVRVRECREGVRLLQAFEPNIRSLRDVSSALVEAHRADLPEVIYRRCRFVTSENERVMQMREALAAGDAPRAGQLLLTTHVGLRDDYEVSCAEIDFLVNYAAEHPAAAGARIMGGGFGGCTINLVRSDQLALFAADALAAYYDQFGVEGEAYPVKLVDGTKVV